MEYECDSKRKWVTNATKRCNLCFWCFQRLNLGMRNVIYLFGNFEIYEDLQKIKPKDITLRDQNEAQTLKGPKGQNNGQKTKLYPSLHL